MAYQNATEILPESLLEQIREYVSGKAIYIPSKTGRRTAWGSKTGSRERYEKRNKEITELYKNNTSIADIAQKYWLSEDSIKKIIKKMPKSV